MLRVCDHVLLSLEIQPDDARIVAEQNISPQKAWAEYVQRQQLLSAILHGKAHPDDILDCLSDQGEAVDEFEEAIDAVVEDVLWTTGHGSI